jgi:hypothetical protein
MLSNKEFLFGSSVMNVLFISNLISLSKNLNVSESDYDQYVVFDKTFALGDVILHFKMLCVCNKSVAWKQSCTLLCFGSEVSIYY